MDGGKILVSTLTGAATGGLSSLKAVDAFVKVYKVVAMGTTAGLGSMAKQQVGKDAKSGKVDVKEVAVDIATKVIPIPKIKVKKVPKSKIKTAKRQLDRAERVNRSNK
ncbi:hypothetical protein V1T75_07955 [Tenacibaculum sp. FZY0031]|uniref:hypothetical protein n=1 Tax=Tenacibaculum sp. FZY0031 TaxID=3116648 RepID=UPI002EC0C164|nr:hypothetical protein [Tenacibaculum sp. FZY0031]